MSELRLRSDLGRIPSYVPGKRPTARADAVRPQTAKLSSNEIPSAPLRIVERAAAELLDQVNRYPGTATADLVERLAEFHAVEPAQIALGCGSVETLSQIIRATCAPGDEVVFAWRSFEAYPLLVAAAGAVAVPVPLTEDARHDLPAMAAAVTDRTRCIIVCTPNNPTGTSVRGAELNDLLASVPTDVVVVIDEAYIQFDDANAIDGLDYVRRYPNVAVARTFSKAYGLAGLRIGYVVAPTQLTIAMRKVSIPFGVTDLAAAAASMSLEAEDELAERVREIRTERERVVAALRDTGWVIPEAHGNFFWLPLGQGTSDAVAVFEDHDLLVRPFLGEGVRVTIADAVSNDRVLAAAAALAAVGPRSATADTDVLVRWRLD